ncbi:MAG: WecB/TagA/CpsF family glycosyltransferase [Candidatus Nanopelagicales bacterium]
MTAQLPLLGLPTGAVGPVPFRVAQFGDAVAAVLETAAGVAGRVVAHDSTAAGIDSPPTPGAPGVAVHFANAYTIALADTQQDYAQLLANPASAVLTDGVPVRWVGSRAYPNLAGRWDRVYGPDIMEAVLQASTPDSPRHYLLGGSPSTLAALQAVIARRWPDAVVVGAESPPFRALTPAEVVAQDSRIRDSGATIVWVGLGTPKQDWEVARLASSIPVVATAVGAAFDFLAGIKPQAPLWMQRSGTEWAFRLACEPRRLARRYLWGNPRFLLAAAKAPGLRRGAGAR